MKDVRFNIVGLEHYCSPIWSVKNLPRTGEYVKSVYFSKTFENFKHIEEFKVVKVIHNYTDGMERIDYTDIFLEICV